MKKTNLVKKWIGKHKKFVIIGSILFALLVTAVCCVTFSLSRIYGSTYDVDKISANIDKIKVGDSINYTANGYSGWKVFSIDKHNGTIDIISKTSVGDLNIKQSETSSFLDILQSEANKYMDGKYAVGVRSVSTEQEMAGIETLGYWVAKTNSDGDFYHSYSYIDFYDYSTKTYNVKLMPVVTIDVGDSSSLNVGDTYSYSLNGVEEWAILYVNDSTSISVVPRTRLEFYPTYDDITNFSAYVQTELEKYSDDNVVSVRSVSTDDMESLKNIRSVIGSFDVYTGEVECKEEISEDPDSVYPTSFYNTYYLKYFSIGSTSYYDRSVQVYTSYTSGFVPIVTLKYGNGISVGELNTNLKVGDYVKYSANAYDSWKVLSIDKEAKTVDVVSGGIVKNLTLKGKEDYDNYESILQDEVNRYMVGDAAISARVLTDYDFEDLKKTGFRYTAKFFLNNKKSYKETWSSYINYCVAIAYWEDYELDFNLKWYELEDLGIHPMSPGASDVSSVTAGIVPVITLKLSDVEVGSEVKTDNSKFVAEQNKANENADMITDEELANSEEIVKDDVTQDKLVNNVSELTYVVNDLRKSIKDLKHLVIAVGVLLVGVLGFLLVGRFRRIK